MDESKYITLEQDIVSLGNRLKSLDDLINVEAIKLHGRFASARHRIFNAYDQRRARQIVRRTIRNANRNLKTIRAKYEKSNQTEDIDLIKSMMILSHRLLEIQQLFL